MFLWRFFYLFKLVFVLLLKRDLTGPVRLRIFFERAGGAFIKFGQILALRQDFLPLSYIGELLKLLNQTSIVPFEKMQVVFAQETGRPVEAFFSEFDSIPIASASIAQVYKAKLKDSPRGGAGGTKVAVKIQKPEIREEFEKDFGIILFLAIVADFFRFYPSFYLQEIVSEFISWTRKELDFTFEAQNAIIVHKHSMSHPRTVVPWQYPALSSPRVLIQELIEDGVAVEDLFFGKISSKELLEKGINNEEMANYLVIDQMRQYFIDGFFHADPHPANLFFLPGNKLVYFDFGIVGRADPQRLFFLKNLYGVAKKDIDFSAKALMEFGSKIMEKEIDIYFKRDVKKHQLTLKIIEKIKELILTDFKRDLANILNPWFEALKRPNATLVEKSAAFVFLETVREGERHGVRFPKEMTLFFRSLSILDMIALHINPNFDIIKVLNLFFEKYPLEEVERMISENGYAGDLGKKIISTADVDWESFKEVALLEKERMMQARERVIDLITYYAERYEELRPLIKNYK